jgi:hypothetical protein
MDAATLSVSLGHFQKVALATSSVFGLVVMARFALLAVSLGSFQSYGAVLRDALIYLVAISIFPSLLRVVIDICGSLAMSISFEPTVVEEDTVNGYLEAVRSGLGFVSVIFDLGRFGVVYIARAIYTLLLAILIAIGPIVLMLSALVGGGGVMAYMNSIALLLLWPVTWNLLGSLAVEVSRSNGQSSLGIYCFWFVVQALQLLSPLFSVFIFKSMAASEALKRPLSAALAVKTAGGSMVLSRLSKRRKK